jgi:hypothetical protein
VQAQLEYVRAAGTCRALGIALRVAGLAEGGTRGLELLGESVAVLEDSPALVRSKRWSLRRRCPCRSSRHTIRRQSAAV